MQAPRCDLDPVTFLNFAHEHSQWRLAYTGPAFTQEFLATKARNPYLSDHLHTYCLDPTQSMGPSH